MVEVAAATLALALAACAPAQVSRMRTKSAAPTIAARKTQVAPSGAAVDAPVLTESNAVATLTSACGDVRPERFARDCTTSPECVSVSHVVDCCGTVRLHGIRADEQERFRAFVQACGMAGSCECLAGPSTTDDGREADPPRTVVVLCERGVCLTVARDG